MKALKHTLPFFIVALSMSCNSSLDSELFSTATPENPGAVVGTKENDGNAIPPAPVLIYPQMDATMDNGCTDFSNPIYWEFYWNSVFGATEYQLTVIGPNSTVPLIKTVIPSTGYRRTSYTFIIDQNTKGWTWQVRAKVMDQWSDWSTGVFHVEPLNTDCPN